MTNELFTIRDARPDDKAVLDGYANLEGMDAIPSIEGVRVAVNEDDEVVVEYDINSPGESTKE